ncbi:hypothetical protein ACWCQZ_02320 [Streptomyces sp. NPDC002285]
MLRRAGAQNPAVSPSHIYWTYGAHNLNNQYDSAVVELCLINSLHLRPHYK